MIKFRNCASAISVILICASVGMADRVPSRDPGLPIDAVPAFLVPELDWAAVAAEDASRSALDEAPRFAIPHKVSVSPMSHGIWEQIDARTMKWSIRVGSPNAVSINLGFERWTLPNSASMTISAIDGSMSIPPFTAVDNKSHGELWTPVIWGEEVLVEIIVSKREQHIVSKQVELTSLNVGYRGFYDEGLDRSGSCNVDVVCAEGDLWWDEIPCVAVISTGGATFCTGFMVNNTSQDRTPYFMTANHCGIGAGNAASLVTYWNYQNSYCRVPGSPDSGNPGDGSLAQFNTGATHLSSGAASDYTIVVLDSQPLEAWEVSYCGWDATGADAISAVGIHQPNTDEKRISFEFQPTTTTDYLGNPIPGDGTHVRIEDWDLGTTEPGSSGSPLFNQDHRIIGQLHGGFASCASQTSDWYGKFSVSFAAGLGAILDSAGTGLLVMNTLPGTGMTVNPGEDVLHICTDPCITPSPLQVTYTIANNSPATISYQVQTVLNTGFILINGGSSASGSLLSGTTVDVVVSVDPFGFSAGIYDEIVRFTDVTNARNVDRNHTLDIGSTEFTTTPAIDFIAGGPLGGPFTATQAYTITSTRPTPFDVLVTPSASWITVNGSATPVTIPLNGIGDTAVVTVGFGIDANALPNGLALGSVLFDNLSGLGGDTSRNVILDVGRFLYVAMDLPQAIIDNTTTTSQIVITDAYCIGDIDIELDLTHTYIGDLIIEVTSPSGTTVRLHDRSGGGADNINLFYDDDGGTLPDGPGLLSDWVGEIVSGTWTMTVSDNAGADQGSLDHWALKIASSGTICPPAANDVEVFTAENTPMDILLDGATPTGNPLDYIITSLPANGSLSELNGTPILLLPHTILSDTVHYQPDVAFIGLDTFNYRVDDGLPSSEGNVIVHVGSLPYPDECISAITLQNGSWDFSTIDATTSVDLYDALLCTGTALGDMNQDVWFSYTACGSGLLTVSTCNLIDFDSDLVLYEGDCTTKTQIACDGDGTGCAGFSSLMTATVTDGTSYLIRVGGWDASSAGSGQILIDGPVGNCSTPCEGDIDGDGTVGVGDVLMIIDQWGVLGGPSDANSDGVVDVLDLLIVVGSWGQCP